MNSAPRGSKQNSSISTPALRRPVAASPILPRSAQPLRARRPRSPMRRTQVTGRGRRRMGGRATTSIPRAHRSRPPSAVCNGWKLKPRPSASCLPSRTRKSLAAGDGCAQRRRRLRKSARRRARRRLDAPVDPSAPMRWAGAVLDPSDPALPDGVKALSDFVQAPPNWRAAWRRSAWFNAPTVLCLARR